MSENILTKEELRNTVGLTIEDFDEELQATEAAAIQ